MRKFCVLKCLFILELRTTFQLPVVSLFSVAVIYNCWSVCLLPQKLVKVNRRLFTKLTGCWNYLLTRCKLRNKFCFCGGNVTCPWNCFFLCVWYLLNNVLYWYKMWQHDFSQTEEATNKISAPGYYLSQFLRSQ